MNFWSKSPKLTHLQLANKYGASGGYYEVGDTLTKEAVEEIRVLQLIARDYSRLLMTGFSEDTSFSWDRMVEAHARWLKP